MILLLLLIATIRVDMLDGTSQAGTLTELTSEQLKLTTDTGLRTVPVAQIHAVTFPATTDPQTGDRPHVTLQDGSRVLPTSLAVDQGTVRLLGLKSSLTEFPTERLLAVQLIQLSEDQRERWRQIRKEAAANDLVVIRKSSGKLDYLPGLLGDVGNETVRFRYENEWLDIRLSKLAGWFYRRNAQAPEKPLATLIQRDGSLWHLRKWSSAGAGLQLETVGGLEFEIETSSVSSLSFAQQNFVYLSDLQPRSQSWKPFILLARSRETLDLFEPVRDRSFDGPLLQLAGDHPGQLRQYNKGLALHSQTTLEYRLAGEYQRLEAVVGLAPEVDGLGHVTMSLSCDGTTLWQADIESSKPLHIDLDVAQRKLLTLIVDYGQGQDIGDRLHLCEPRLYR